MRARRKRTTATAATTLRACNCGRPARTTPWTTAWVERTSSPATRKATARTGMRRAISSARWKNWKPSNWTSSIPSTARRRHQRARITRTSSIRCTLPYPNASSIHTAHCSASKPNGTSTKPKISSSRAIRTSTTSRIRGSAKLRAKSENTT